MRVGLWLAFVEICVASPVIAADRQAKVVLDAAAVAMGRFDENSTIELRGSVDAEGRTGEYREVVRMRDGAYLTHAQYSLFGEGEGFDGRVRWKQDRSGATHSLNAPFTKADTATLAWLKRRGYLNAGSARLERLQHTKIGDRAVTVLTMRPRRGNSIRLAFDDATHLLTQSERTRPLDTITETYGDYRRAGRSKAPFSIDIEESGDHQLIHASNYQPQKKAPANRFSAPLPPRDTLLTEAATVPLESPGFAVVSARINGHEFDFILDTGGHNIVTPAVAVALGLRSEGQGSSGGSGPGRVAVSDTAIAKLELGSATMTNQHFTVLDMDGAVKRKGKPDMAGILGLEVFERMAVTIDEPHGRLTIEPSRSGRSCDGDAIPLLFDDDQPAVRGTIDGIPAQIGIDVGNGGIPIVLWRWAEAHKVADRFRNGTPGSGSGVGGKNTTYRTAHHEIVVGRTVLRDSDVNYATTPTGYFSSRADSMNLGRALLQKYVVRFDYAQGQMCVMRP